MAKNLIILNLAPGDGEGNLIDNASLFANMDSIADGGKPFARSGYQHQWLVDDTHLTEVEDHINSFIGEHVFAYTPAYVVIPVIATS